MKIKGILNKNVILLDKQAIEELHQKSHYGRHRNGNLEISLVEGAFLMYMEKISIESDGAEINFEEFFLRASSILDNFELLYIVYKDLRERGYYVQPGVTGFRVYPRGGHPGKTPAEFFVFVISERIPLPLSTLMRHLETVENLKKRLVAAIVDEESDITYYTARNTNPEGNYRLLFNKRMSTASLLEDRVIVWEKDVSKALISDGFFGKPMDEGHLQLSLVESCYLLKNGILEIEDRDNEKMDIDMFSKRALNIESDFLIKYAVYEKLRNNGLVPKTGFKFGTHFRVYKKIDDMIKLPHSDYLVHAIDRDHIFSLQQLSRAIRLANSVRKEMIFGTVDSQVDFVIIERIRL